MVAGRDAIYLTGDRGEILAVSPKDGSQLWRKKVEKTTTIRSYVSVAGHPRGGMVFLAIEDTLFALQAATGQVAWQWQWKPVRRPRERGPIYPPPQPMVRPAQDGLFVVVNWYMDRDTSDDQTDVVFLSYDGRVIFSHTSPNAPAYGSRHAANPFVAGRSLTLHRRGWEIWDRSGVK